MPLANAPGTGKTVYVKDVLEGLDKGRFTTIQTAFSARTSANQTQVGGPACCVWQLFLDSTGRWRTGQALQPFTLAPCPTPA